MSRYILDNDLHIHTFQSTCSTDEGQTPEAILKIAKERGMKTICLTDHYWDDLVPSNTLYNWWYEQQNYDNIAKSLPLPKDDEVRFLFGCEVDVDSSNRIGLPKERWDDFGFIIVSTTHFHHMIGPEWENRTPQQNAKLWIERFDTVLNADLPFGKVGIAHLACGLIGNSKEDTLASLDAIPEEELKRLFTKAADLGLGIELNVDDLKFNDEEADTVLRMFRIAKACGCKFYFGSDAHERDAFEGVDPILERAIDLLDLKEEDKFIVK